MKCVQCTHYVDAFLSCREVLIVVKSSVAVWVSFKRCTVVFVMSMCNVSIMPVVLVACMKFLQCIVRSRTVFIFLFLPVL